MKRESENELRRKRVSGNRRPLAVKLRWSAIACIYYLQFGEVILRGSLWGHLLGRCSGSPRPAQVGRLHKGPFHDSPSQGVGERRKIVYADDKYRLCYAL
jgi:hypothetical protein